MKHIENPDIARTFYSGIIQPYAYSEPCVTLAWAETWYIRNPGIF